MSPFILPPDVELGALRRYAKRLYHVAASGEGGPEILASFAAVSKTPSLTAAQLLVAREYGFSSWAKLKEQVARNSSDPGALAIGRARKRRNRDVPWNEGCGVVPIGRVAARTPYVSLALPAVLVYSWCFVVELDWAFRRQSLGPSAWHELLRWVAGNPFDPYPSTDAFVRQVGRAAVTVEYADGRSASSLTADWTQAVRARPEVEVPLLDCRGISGAAVGESAWYSRGQLILSPLPPPGELRLAFAWPAVGLRDVEVTLSGSDVRAAAARVRRFAGVRDEG